MPFTRSEAKILGALALLNPAGALTVPQLRRATGTPETSIHRALLRLSLSGLVSGTVHGPARWHCTNRGRLAITRPVCRDYIGGRT